VVLFQSARQTLCHKNVEFKRGDPVGKSKHLRPISQARQGGNLVERLTVPDWLIPPLQHAAQALSE